MVHRTRQVIAAILSGLISLGFGFSQSRAARLEKIVRADIEALTRTATSFKGKTRSESANESGDVAYDFTLTDLRGKRVDLKSLRGHVVLLNFWASWCPFCVEEMPYVESLRRRYGKEGLVVLGINKEDAETARAFLKAHGYTFTTLVDEDGTVGENYGIKAIPTTIVIGRDGRIIARLVGAQGEEDLLVALREAGLKEKGQV